MASSNELYRFSVAVLFGITFSAVGCAGTEVHQQGGSTAVIKQSGPSSTQVTKTSSGQKIITRDGNSTDVTIQRSGKSGSGKSSGKGASTTKSRIEADRFSRGSSDCDDCSPSRKTSSKDTDIPTSNEFKDRMRSRMRPLSPKP